MILPRTKLTTATTANVIGKLVKQQKSETASKKEVATCFLDHQAIRLINLPDRESFVSTSASSKQNRSYSSRKTTFICRQKILTTLSLVIPLLIVALASVVSCVVVYQVRFIATKNGRTDYALAGDSIELSCHYIMKDEAEEVKQLIWSKDGKNFLRWRKNRIGLEVLNYTFKGHLDKSSTFQHLIIHNVTIDMHGKYKCLVKTDLGSHEAEQDLVVISQTGCKFSDWRVISQPSQCREIFHFDCRNMFPKPEPSCGLWNAKLERFIRSVMVDISEEVATNNNAPQTYRVKYSGNFELGNPSMASSTAAVAAAAPQGNGQSVAARKQQNNNSNADLLQYAGHLMFKCDISVPDTSWKLSLVHRMFDYQDACFQDPLEAIERMQLSYSQYAQLRLQQSGLVNQGNDYELIKMISASNLEYKIIPASSRTSTNGLSSLPMTGSLNCWQKPRFGSLARLSCANKAGQMKLMGPNLLQCQPSGWVPVMNLPTREGRKQQQEGVAASKMTGRRKIPIHANSKSLIRLGRRISNSRPPTGSIMQNSDLYISSQPSNLSSGNQQLTLGNPENIIYLDPRDSDDSESDNVDNNVDTDDEDTDDSSSIIVHEQSSRYETTTHQTATSTSSNLLREFEFIPTGDQIMEAKQQLATIPPTCVSSIVKAPKVSNFQSNANLNALSSSRNSHSSSPAKTNHQGGFSFGFSSSSTASMSTSSILEARMMISLHILITCLIHTSTLSLFNVQQVF